MSANGDDGVDIVDENAQLIQAGNECENKNTKWLSWIDNRYWETPGGGIDALPENVIVDISWVTPDRLLIPWQMDFHYVHDKCRYALWENVPLPFSRPLISWKAAGWEASVSYLMG